MHGAMLCDLAKHWSRTEQKATAATASHLRSQTFEECRHVTPILSDGTATSLCLAKLKLV